MPLPTNVVNDLVEALEENGMRGKSTDEKLARIAKASPYENINLWLVWNGIIGFTPNIIRCVLAAYGYPISLMARDINKGADHAVPKL